MADALAEIPQWTNVDADTFHNEILPLNKPAHLKSLVGNWPAVKSAQVSPQTIAGYLKGFDRGGRVHAVVGEPAIEGRFFYREDLQGVNFKQADATVGIAVDRLMTILDHPAPHAIAIQAVPITETLPGFAAQNPQPLLEDSVSPTMWLGNRGMVAPHYDIHDNLACVVAGLRKFTVFPPDQIKNLYVGPILKAPGGVPISMVDLRAPDLEIFPRFSQALDVAQEATLSPGDAIYIPALWWHAVESLKKFNVLVNYWWGGMSESRISPNDSLWHAMLTIAKLDPAKRSAWRSFFEHYVFQSQDNPTEHIPKEVDDLVTSLDPEQQAYVYKFLSDRLK